jgi:thiol-disulfide isomerase/thioredoxin
VSLKCHRFVNVGIYSKLDCKFDICLFLLESVNHGTPRLTIGVSLNTLVVPYRGIDQMPAISHWVRLGMCVLAAVAILSSTAGSALLVEAQDPPSMIGRSPLYSLSGATGWINSKPLTAKQLKGKVVLVDFWAYSCINCLRSLPYIEAWAQKYKDSGLVVIGVHTPEFGFEQKLPNVQQAVQRFGVTFPVALDSKYSIWNAFHNQAWPADYFIDTKGKVRYQHFGEGGYDESERWIQELLKETNAKPMPATAVSVQAQGVQAAADMDDVRSPETYIGYARAQHFASPGGIKRDVEQLYTEPADPQLNEWGLAGKWVDHEQFAVLKAAAGKIIFHFQARDLHLVLGPTDSGKPVRFRVTIDGRAPGDNHGVDTDAEGNGVVTTYRLYQLVRQRGTVTQHIFTIEFLDPGAQAFSFTFG